jgi:hypothetical protein
MFALTPLPKHIWKFLRMRPMNFPTVRIAQLASLLHCAQGLFAKSMAAATTDDALKLFDSAVSDYWNTHYTFGAPSTARSKALGKHSAERIVANVLTPVMYHYGQTHNDETLCRRAVEMWEQLPPEDNACIDVWRQQQLPPRSMLESQALLQLTNEYCNKKRCLHCAVGRRIIG